MLNPLILELLIFIKTIESEIGVLDICRFSGICILALKNLIALKELAHNMYLHEHHSIKCSQKH